MLYVLFRPVPPPEALHLKPPSAYSAPTISTASTSTMIFCASSEATVSSCVITTAGTETPVGTVCRVTPCKEKP